jgi:SAM-dependent methyltransferase
MPAQPEGQQDRVPSANQPHQARQIAESFGSDTERYDRTPPPYPDALVEAIVAASPGRDVVDVGSGTGIAARQFQSAGCRVLGVEPDARMAEFARRTGVETEVAKFEDWDSAGRQFDAVIAGQAWHWVDPVAGAAKAAQVLRPDGRLAVFWNAFQPPPDLADAFAAVYRRELPDLPFNPWAQSALDAYLGMGAKAADGMRQAVAFSQPDQWQFEWHRLCTRDEWLDQVPSAGGHSLLPPAQLDALLAGMGAEIDAAGGSFTAQYTALVVIAARTGSTP